MRQTPDPHKIKTVFEDFGFHLKTQMQKLLPQYSGLAQENQPDLKPAAVYGLQQGQQQLFSPTDSQGGDQHREAYGGIRG